MKKAAQEKLLAKKCKKGDRQAQRQLYEKYSTQFFGICLRYLKNREEAEDLLTQGFVKIFNKIGQFKGAGSFEGWMKRIMVNECLNHLRKQRILYADVEIHNLSNEPNYNMTEQNLNAEELLKLIQELPAGYRTVFNLYAIEGYSHQEIADMLNISEGTSKSQLSRARKILQNNLKKIDNSSSEVKYG